MKEKIDRGQVIGYHGTLIVDNVRPYIDQLESENAALKAELKEEKDNSIEDRDESRVLIKNKDTEIRNLKGALRTLANDDIACNDCRAWEDSAKDSRGCVICKHMRNKEACVSRRIASALAHPTALDEISSKDYGADGVGLNHDQVNAIEEDK